MKPLIARELTEESKTKRLLNFAYKLIRTMRTYEDRYKNGERSKEKNDLKELSRKSSMGGKWSSLLTRACRRHLKLLEMPPSYGSAMEQESISVRDLPWPT